jgi:hypothetical protein
LYRYQTNGGVELEDARTGDVASSMRVSLNTCCSSLAMLTSAFLDTVEISLPVRTRTMDQAYERDVMPIEEAHVPGLTSLHNSGETMAGQ